jgi:hypothetical protein
MAPLAYMVTDEYGLIILMNILAQWQQQQQQQQFQY